MDELWGSLSTNLEVAIASLIGKAETLQLDFKCDDHRSPMLVANGLTANAKKTLTKAISAFSNSAGGLLVIGVDCRRNKDGVDIAEELRPISPLDRWKQEVTSVATELIQPRQDGIEVLAIERANEPNSGYLVLRIPRSDRRPHRCQLTHYYFKRAGTSSFAMEHYDVEDAFRRIGAPNLKMNFAIEHFGEISGAEQNQRFQCIMRIENIGEVSAKNVAVRVVGHGFDTGHLKHNEVVVDNDSRLFIARPSIVIHPGMSLNFEQLSFRIMGYKPALRLNNIQIPSPDAGFDYTIYAENMRPVSGRFAILHPEFQAICKSVR